MFMVFFISRFRYRSGLHPRIGVWGSGLGFRFQGVGFRGSMLSDMNVPPTRINSTYGVAFWGQGLLFMIYCVLFIVHCLMYVVFFYF